MKYITLALFAAFALAACNNETKTEETSAQTTTTEAAAEPIAAGPKDPVCDMVKDATWTEYAVNGTDTVWFCSETCKTAYNGNPAKYAGKLAQ